MYETCEGGTRSADPSAPRCTTVAGEPVSTMIRYGRLPRVQGAARCEPLVGASETAV